MSISLSPTLSFTLWFRQLALRTKFNRQAPSTYRKKLHWILKSNHIILWFHFVFSLNFNFKYLSRHCILCRMYTSHDLNKQKIWYDIVIDWKKWSKKKNWFKLHMFYVTFWVTVVCSHFWYLFFHLGILIYLIPKLKRKKPIIKSQLIEMYTTCYPNPKYVI